MKKRVAFIVAVIMVVALMPLSAFATSDAIDVYQGDALKKSVTLDELKTVQENEGNESYSFAGYNTFGSYNMLIDDAKGPTLKGILKEAGIDYAGIADNTKIRFCSGSDPASITLTGREIKEERYYFPYGDIGTQLGMRGTDKSRENKAVEPIIVDINDVDSSLRIGQVNPNEQNWPAHIKYMLGGKIIVTNENAAKIAADITTSVSNRQVVYPGENIKLNAGSHFMKVYYTTDGTTPTKASDIYNYNSYSGADRSITAPAAPNAKLTIKCFKSWYGSLDSDVQTFTYTVAALPAAGSTSTAGKCKYKVTKSAVSGGTVTFTGFTGSGTSASVPSTVKINGYTFTVDKIGSKAFYKKTKLKSVTIGASVTSIGSKAFYGDKRLKTIKVKTKKITSSKKIGSRAFKGIYKKAKIKVLASKYKKYKKYFAGKGQARTVKIVKL